MTDDKAKKGEQIAAPAGAISAIRLGKKQRKKFLRYEWFKCKKLGLKWRRPVGLHSKVRQGRKGKPPQVNIGYGHARATRGLHTLVVHNVSELEHSGAKYVALANGLGLRAVDELARKATQLGIIIVNKEKVVAAQHRVWLINKQREERAKAKSVKTEVKAEAKKEMKAEAKKEMRVQAETKPTGVSPVPKKIEAPVKTGIKN